MQAHPGALGLLCTAAIVTHEQAQALGATLQAHPHLAGTGMPGDVGQRLLQQAVQMRSARPSQRRQVLANPQPAFDALAGLPLAHQQPEGLGQRHVVQRHRIQVVHQRAKTLLQALAIEFKGLRRLRHHFRLFGHHTQQV
ncbi:hypothetical protein D3C78_1477300 [compost metagenome]